MAAGRAASLRVREIYPAVIGESSWAGAPSLLVRLTGCNLRCTYCDTAYAWKGGRTMRVTEIVTKVKSKGHDTVLLTGGEPLAQPDSPVLIQRLIDRGVKVLIETNGSIDLTAVPRPAHLVMDLKTPGSGQERHNRLANLDLLKPDDDLKLVLTSRRDYRWALKMMEAHDLSARCQVYLNPAAGLLDPKLLVKWMLKDRPPARLGLQLHKCIFGDQAKRV